MVGSSRFAFPRRGRAARLIEQCQVREQLVSVAGLVHRPVTLDDGRDVGRLLDIVVDWTGATYPAVKGVVVGIGRRQAFVGVDQVGKLGNHAVTLSSPRLDVRDFEVRTGKCG